MPRKSSARKAGKTRGRKPDANSKSGQVRALLGSGMSPADIAKKVGCTVGLVYNLKSKMGQSRRRGPGRPPKASAGSVSRNGLDGLIAAVKDTERDRAQLRTALERIQAVIADVLG